MDEVQIRSIVHDAKKTPPLLVTFIAGGQEYTIRADAGQIQTFGLFQRLVANRLGLWLRFGDGERAGKVADLWQDAVETAFSRKQ